MVDSDSDEVYMWVLQKRYVAILLLACFALVWLARPSQYAPAAVVGKGRSSGDSD